MDYLTSFGISGEKQSVENCPLILALRKEGFDCFWVFDNDGNGFIYNEEKIYKLPAKICVFLNLFDKGKLNGSE